MLQKINNVPISHSKFHTYPMWLPHREAAAFSIEIMTILDVIKAFQNFYERWPNETYWLEK
jgi:hypothetical protein